MPLKERQAESLPCLNPMEIYGDENPMRPEHPKPEKIPLWEENPFGARFVVCSPFGLTPLLAKYIKKVKNEKGKLYKSILPKYIKR